MGCTDRGKDMVSLVVCLCFTDNLTDIAELMRGLCVLQTD
jgi:hypothetical protein